MKRSLLIRLGVGLIFLTLLLPMGAAALQNSMQFATDKLSSQLDKSRSNPRVRDRQINQASTSKLIPNTSQWTRIGTILIIVLAGALSMFRFKLLKKNKMSNNEAVRRSEDRLKWALWGSGDGLWDWNLRENKVYRSGLEEITDNLGTSQLDDWHNKNVHPDDRQLQNQNFRDYLDGDSKVYESEYRVKNHSGHWEWILDRGKVVERDDNQHIIRVAGTHKVITQQKAVEQQLQLSSEIIRNIHEAVIVADRNFHFVSVNPAFTQLTGYDATEIIGDTFTRIQSNNHPTEFYFKIRELLVSESYWKGELWLRCKDGDEILCAMEQFEVSGWRNIAGHYVAVFSDITESRQAEDDLRKMAQFDTLTGLPNRTLLQDRLQQAIAHAKRYQTQLALLFIDLDKFKCINDSLGHDAGDQLLQEVAQRLSSCVREEDTVARLGGDEFTIVLGELESEHSAESVAKKAIQALSKAVHLGNHSVVVSPSIGIAIYPNDGLDVTSLLKYSDIAMYYAKEKGRNNYQFYTQEMNDNALQRIGMEKNLRKGLNSNEFSLQFQPKINLENGLISGAEALIRWQTKGKPKQLAREFIPIAEESDIINEIGEWVIANALMFCKQWQQHYAHPLPVSINVSAHQLHKGNLLSAITHELKSTDIDSKLLNIEFVENAVMSPIEQSQEQLHKLKEHHIGLALDDFGTGYSSISHLTQLPIDTVKIDISFIRNINENKSHQSIARAIIALAHSLDINVIAEGVETIDQLTLLQKLGCDEVQGYLISPPLSSNDLIEFLDNFEINNLTDSLALTESIQ